MVLTRSQCQKCSDTSQHTALHDNQDLQCDSIDLLKPSKLEKHEALSRRPGRISCEWCKRRFKHVAALAQHCKALHSQVDTHTTESNAGVVGEAPTEMLNGVKDVEVEQHLTIPAFSFPGQSSAVHLDILSHRDHDSNPTSTSHSCSRCDKEFADDNALFEHLLDPLSHTDQPSKTSKRARKAKRLQRERAAAAEHLGDNNLKSASVHHDQLRCSRCHKKFKILSALVQHLESGKCKSSSERAVEKKLLGITSQFSRALTL